MPVNALNARYRTLTLLMWIYAEITQKLLGQAEEVECL